MYFKPFCSFFTCCIITVILLTGCNHHTVTQSGLVVNRLRYFDEPTQDYIHDDLFWPDARVYFRDSMVVEEIRYLYMDDPVHHLPRRVETAKFIFIDLPARRYYEYTSFTDTARLINSGAVTDTAEMVSGWNFWGCGNPIPSSIAPEKMTDTLMNGKTLSRYLFISYREKGGITLTDRRFVYLDCARKGTMFQYAKCFSIEAGCPVVRFDYFPERPSSRFSTISARVEILRDSLTEQENRVFDTWIKYAKKTSEQK